MVPGAYRTLPSRAGIGVMASGRFVRFVKALARAVGFEDILSWWNVVIADQSMFGIEVE